MSDLHAELGLVDTTCLRDAAPALGVLPSAIRQLSPGRRMVGRAITVIAADDLVPVLAGLELAGPGDVLVIAGGSLERALLGELFATEAVRRGMTGVVVDGLCRDSAQLARMPLAIYARGTSPAAAGAVASPLIQVPIEIGPVTVQPGDLVVGDEDGVLVGNAAVFADALAPAEAIQGRELDLRTRIENGESLFDHLNLAAHIAAIEAGGPSALTFS